MRFVMASVLASAILGSVGCTDVQVKKIRTPTQYDVWTDDDQRREDAKEGFRFYMQRPFLTVYQPFPVHARSYLVGGRISMDGRFVVLDGIPEKCTKTEGDELRDVMRLCYGCDGAGVPTAMIFEPQASAGSRGGGGQKAAGEQGADDAADDAATPKADAEPPAGPSLTSPLPNVIGGMENDGTRGITELGVTVSNDPYPMTPLRTPLFDIVNLPDFDEQFVVRRVQGIGSSSMELGLGQGNLLQGFDARLDNSSVSNLLYGLMYTAANVLVAKNLNPLGIQAMTPGSVGAAKPAKKPGEQGDNADPVAYAAVTMRVHVITYATPGLYPIMKPRECADWDRAAKRRDECGRANCTALACRSSEGMTVVRMGPYGVPYNTFQYVLVEWLDRGTGAMPVIPPEKPMPSAADLEALVKKDVLDNSANFRATVIPQRTSFQIVIYQLDKTVDPTSADRDKWKSASQELARAQGMTRTIEMPMTAEQRTRLAAAINEKVSEFGWEFALEPEVDGKLELKRVRPTQADDKKKPVMEAALKVFRIFIAKEDANGRSLAPLP
ncbi:MAG: hypothetical protein U1E39_00720 [Planctomycetota bacterium]